MTGSLVLYSWRGKCYTQDTNHMSQITKLLLHFQIDSSHEYGVLAPKSILRLIPYAVTYISVMHSFNIECNNPMCLSNYLGPNLHYEVALIFKLETMSPCRSSLNVVLDSPRLPEISLPSYILFSSEPHLCNYPHTSPSSSRFSVTSLRIPHAKVST